ncbi:MAG: hypothetical protein E6I76_11755 [Chloroflexi bacterium]|nr:MAG: hypothetical protein E6I76_11755 [Chloroflexota bacterium]
MIPGRTYVAPSTLHGRGVFAAVPIAAGEVIEVCPVLRFPAAQREHIDATLIDEYYFDWDGDGAIALGLGSLYNHADEPIAEYIKDTANDVAPSPPMRRSPSHTIRCCPTAGDACGLSCPACLPLDAYPTDRSAGPPALSDAGRRSWCRRLDPALSN